MPVSNTNTLRASAPIAASDATRVRVLAGTPHSRRGSVLVLVVGVLALLAIIIVVYTSVGQADVRGGRTLVNQARLDDQSKTMGDYIRTIVGNDASATRVQRVMLPTGASVNLGVHEGTDYPYTDPFARSQLTGAPTPVANPEFARFDPAGNINNQWNAAGSLDPRVSSDPFLSSGEPTWINRTFTTLPGIPRPFPLMGRQRDWGHLSLISPSGLPVNLATLRGNWAAPSGFSNNPYGNTGQLRTSDWLHYWTRTNDAAGYNATPNVLRQTDTDLYNSPAFWSNDRTETFRPVTWNPSGYFPGDVRFMGNMLGDADGDGFYDSLWQELVDVSDPARSVNLLPGGTGGGVRWFIAPRIIDLSGLVNVNTATNFAVAPDAENPAGITPGDIDLERLLSTVDARQYFGIDPAATYVSGGASYGTAEEITAAGRWAFAGILEGRATGLAEAIANPYLDTAGPQLISPQWLEDIGVQRSAGNAAIGSVTRRTLYTMAGKDDADGQLRTPIDATTGHFLKQPGGYGNGDEYELRLRGALNEPAVTSRIEANSATTEPRNTPANGLMSPFRFGRDLITEKDGALALTVTVDGETVPRALAQYFSDARHSLTTLSGSRPFANTLLAAPLNPGEPVARPLTEADLRQDINSLLQRALAVTPSATNNSRGIYPITAANTIFSNYALALSPFLGGVGPGAPSQSLWNLVNNPDDARNLPLSFGGVTYNTATSGTNVGELISPAFKGRAAEIALRSAGHMTLNLLASRDYTNANNDPLQQPDGRPIGATLLLDEGQRGAVATDAYPGGGRKFPFWQAGAGRLGNEPAPANALGSGRNDFKAFTFDLNGGQSRAVQRLAGETGAPVMTTRYAVNMFAAQPQPFITAAAAFDMYYDAPSNNGGDGQASSSSDTTGEWWVSDPNTTPPTIESLGITINGDVSLNNADFLLEAISFQLTNPFDTVLTLGDDAGNFAYYFEFAGNFYDCRPYDDDGNRLTGPVRLQPRQSLNFYVLSHQASDIMTRWRSADPSVTGLAAMGETPLKTWLSRQLNVTEGNGRAVRTMQIDRTNGNVINHGMPASIMASSATSNSNKVVKLWRVVLDRPATESETANRPENDYLVDRIHDPSYGDGSRRSALFRRLDSGHNRFLDIHSGPEPTERLYQGPVVQADNVGFALTSFGSIRRRTDPSGGPKPGEVSDTNTGVMPAWCVEAKVSAGFTSTLNSRNIADTNPILVDSGDVGPLSSTHFTGTNTWANRSAHAMLSDGINRNYTTASTHPASRRADGPNGLGGLGDDVSDKIGDDLNGVSWTAGAKAMQLPVYPRRNTAATRRDVQLPPLRPADLLMPWAIGPYQYADMDPANDEDRNVTLSEAMAMGLNYSRADSTAAYEFQIGKVLDRCHLPTDRFVPFNNTATPGEWTYANGGPDPYISNGVPFALNILDRFRATRYGSIDSVMPGTININTASLNVLRTLPFLTPVSQNIFARDSAAFKGNWINSTGTPFSLDLRNEAGVASAQSLWAANETWDVAATLVAYRDQMAVVARGRQGDETGASRVYVDFSRGTATVTGNDGNRYNTAAGKHTGRAFMNNVVNARQELGFRSPGEVMLALIQDDTTRVGTQNAANLRKNSIDRLVGTLNADGSQSTVTNFEVPVKPIMNVVGRGLPTSVGNETARTQGIAFTAFNQNRRTGAGNTDHFVQGGKSSDYDRKIAVANALLNCVTTSSDIYCAYFLVNGYTEGDTTGLEAYTGAGNATDDRFTRPMTPSIQRRYMMVLDRSACVRAGDKPKVLMFEELPVN